MREQELFLNPPPPSPPYYQIEDLLNFICHWSRAAQPHQGRLFFSGSCPWLAVMYYSYNIFMVHRKTKMQSLILRFPVLVYLLISIIICNIHGKGRPKLLNSPYTIISLSARLFYVYLLRYTIIGASRTKMHGTTSSRELVSVFAVPTSGYSRNHF